MEDQLISHETAVLAIKVGIEKDIWIEYDEIQGTTDSFESIHHQITQSLLQRWLREEHNIHINCMFSNREDINGYFYGIIESKESEDCKVYETYEEALEVGLQEALKLIK